MLKKEERTMEVYKDLGGRMRLLKDMVRGLQVDMRKVLTASECDSLGLAFNYIDKVCDKVENKMFKDHYEISDEHLSVFYGSVKRTPINKVDEEVIELAKKSYDGFFK